jgi:hypothetical protein
MEHQHCFFYAAESFDRPGDGNVEPPNAEQSEKCEPSDSVQHNGNFAGLSFSF